jgi:outer membrane protein insertion porin family
LSSHLAFIFSQQSAFPFLGRSPLSFNQRMSYGSFMRHSTLCLLLTFFCSCAFAPYLLAQGKTSPTISFTGAPNYSQAELLAFTGLKSSSTQQQMDAAAQRLSDTGLFEEVNFSGNSKGIVFTLKPAKATRAAGYSNFVLWSDDELDRSIKARVPLYRAAAVPVGSKMEDAISAALTAILEEKGIAGASITLMPKGKELVFSIGSPSVRIHSLTLNGASAAMQPKIDHVVHEMTGLPWDNESFKDVSVRVGDDYRNEGYRDFALVKQERSAPAITANGIELDLTASISEGAQYHVSQFNWAGSDALSTAQFKKVVTLKVGGPDSVYSLQESLILVAKAYRAKGYTLAVASAPPVVDPAAHQVAYTVSVEPGPLHHFNSVRFVGIGDDLAKQLNAAWQMKQGDIYDDSYAYKFITENSALNSALTKQGYRESIRPKLDTATHTADITITFSKATAPKSN